MQKKLIITIFLIIVLVGMGSSILVNRRPNINLELDYNSERLSKSRYSYKVTIPSPLPIKQFTVSINGTSQTVNILPASSVKLPFRRFGSSKTLEEYFEPSFPPLKGNPSAEGIAQTATYVERIETDGYLQITVSVTDAFGRITSETKRIDIEKSGGEYGKVAGRVCLTTNRFIFCRYRLWASL